jgi:hypothetical protein
MNYNEIFNEMTEDDSEILFQWQIMNQELAEPSSKRKGSIVGRRVVDGDFEAGHMKIFDDYFAEEPVYLDDQFERRFRMPSMLVVLATFNNAWRRAGILIMNLDQKP